MLVARSIAENVFFLSYPAIHLYSLSLPSTTLSLTKRCSLSKLLDARNLDYTEENIRMLYKTNGSLELMNEIHNKNSKN